MSSLIIFEVLVILFTVGIYGFMKMKQYKNVERKFLILLVSILLFEFMSEPMWQNTGFQKWAYIWGDLTWIITLGWAAIFMFTFIFVDYLFRKTSERRRFWIYLFVLELIVVPIESWLITSGIRSYAPLLANTFSGYYVPFTVVPIEPIFAVPLFTSLIIGFYKYLNYIFSKK